ncbi:AAA family ATPase [Hyphomicrobium sp. 2TAF46]|uniref:AAA family ATPase n=1 Tax=Hyphomicrobium sp. 2TAF46 TaxID=3233019 RepID=UPI003F8E0C19
MDQILVLLLWAIIGGVIVFRLRGGTWADLKKFRLFRTLAPKQSLGTELHTISKTLEPFARDSAHTNELAENADFKSAVALLADPKVPLETVFDYAFGQNWPLSCAAFAALKQRPDALSSASKVLPRFDGLSVWQMTFAFQYFLKAYARPPAGAFLVGLRDWWSENVLLRHLLSDHFTALGEDEPAEVGPEVMALPLWKREQIRDFLALVSHPMAVRLAAKVVPAGPQQETSSTTSPSTSSFLSSIGRFWANNTENGLLIEPQGWKDALGAAQRLVDSGSLRILLVSGEPYVGKTSFLKLLADRIAAKEWRVFQASGADLQAGQMYIGQLEGRIREVLQELDAGNKVIWYVPDLLGLALSGTHQAQSASILDQIMPAVAAGRLLIWAEASLAATTKLQQLKPAVRRHLEIVRMEDMDEEEAIELAETLAARLEKTTRTPIDPSFARTSVDVAQSYLTAMHLPGSALSLMKMTAVRSEKEKVKRLGSHEILATLSQLTGLPLSILDGAERLSLEEVRGFFQARVIGQPHAVAALVERIAMLKSGLNDPGKPIGVFLFAGPTGTGKTELAKTVADYLFGAVDRMIRLDMSEYQTYEGAQKILGGGNLPADAETLVARIRKQPFSVVLLDEFEKAHPQIWDLFLQVFDEGRLTDATGQTADFRHCIIILTSNLGATTHRDSGSIGFKPSSSGFTDEQIHKAISQTFRPEFQNRLDKIVVFKPLTRELMRGILMKELAHIFERRGLKDRAWAVEWDASALEFLLEKGFSPEMGARPLKRAIDHYLIAPLAETIVERRFPEGDQFVFVRRDGGALRADFVDPDGKSDVAVASSVSAHTQAGAPQSLFDMMRTPSGDASEIASLAAAHEPIAQRIESVEWAAAKAELTREIGLPDFWSRADRSQTLARLELMDRIEVATETATSLEARLARQTGKSMRDLIARLAMQIHLVNEGLKDLDEKAPVEAALIVEPAFVMDADDGEAATAWCAELGSMYRAWARNRNMYASEIDAIPGVDANALIVGGFGAYRALAREAGLHILEKSEVGGSRVTAQVLIAKLPLGDASKAEIRQTLAGAFGAKAKRGTNIVRRYRKGATPLVRNGDGSVRSGRVEDVLRGNFDLFALEQN